jgi:hypothetical protein
LSGHYSQGLCNDNPSFMSKVCPLTCKICESDEQRPDDDDDDDEEHQGNDSQTVLATAQIQKTNYDIFPFHILESSYKSQKLAVVFTVEGHSTCSAKSIQSE